MDAKAESESVEVAAEKKLDEVTEQIKQIAHVLEETRREVKMLHNRDDKRQNLRRIVRSETQSALQEMEEKLEGKAETIEAPGQKKGKAKLRAGDDKFQMLEKKIKSLREKIDSSAKSLEKTQTEVNSLKTAIAKQLRCLSGFQLLEKCCCHHCHNGERRECKARVTFNPAFSGTPDLSFGLFGPVQLESRSVAPTHVDFIYYIFQTGCPKVNVQWIACGHLSRAMTDNMVLEFFRSYQ